MLKPKNILIFIGIGAVLVLIYIFFIKATPEQAGLVSSTTNGEPTSTNATTNGDTLGAKNFLSILLNVKNIKLDDSIFSDAAFNTLQDSSIILTPDGTEGRPNPFAPIGTDKTTTILNNSASSSTVTPAPASSSTGSTPPSVAPTVN